MTSLHIDIETFSEVNLKTEGLYKYAANCELLLVAIRYDKRSVKLYDYTQGERIPQGVIDDLQDPEVIKYAHNAPFELACLSNCLEIQLFPEQWICTMSLCAMAGLPMDLFTSSRILKLTEQKDDVGSALIRLFCIPCKPSKVNGQHVRNLPEHYPEKWNQFRGYNIQDVLTESELSERLSFIHLSPFERKVWMINEQINNRGIKIDKTLARNAIEMDITFRDRLIKEAIEITRLDKPTSVKQLKAWLADETGELIPNLQKKNIPKMIESFESEVAKRVLTIREQLSKTSVTKYSTMIRAVLSDGRIKGLLQYCGAGRTWRFAGRLVQMQNLVKGKYKYHKEIDFDDLDFARTLLLNGEMETLELLYGPVPDTLSNLVRTAFVAPKGRRFIVSDFSAIEARILAWLANERWRLKVFATHGKIYEASAAKILKKPLEEVTRKERSEVGKISELALGYQGSENALIVMAEKENIKIDPARLKPLVTDWRNENPNIVNLWYAANSAAIRAINTGERVYLTDINDRYGNKLVDINYGVYFEYKNGYLMTGLPSGHCLYYYNASLVPGKFGGVQIQYWGQDQVKKVWCRMHTYGGKLIENICQAIGRDCLVNGMVNLYDAGYETVIHVHDETVNECDDDFGSLEEVNALMIKPAPWMRDLPMKAEGFVTKYYKKD